MSILENSDIGTFSATNDKTVTMSRELAQKVDDLLYIMTGHDSYPRLIHKYGKEWWTPVNEMRAEICTLLAAPVVERQEPAAWIVTDMNGDSYFAYDKQTPSDKPLYTSPPAPVAVVTREQVEIVAESIYWQWAGREGFVPWVKGGNSLKQDEARSIAWSTLDKVKELNAL